MCKKNILTIAAVAILAPAIGRVQAVTVTVPNSDFELIYKPGQTTITGAVSGGGWTQGVGPDCPIDNGTYEFDDASTGDVADIPGWLGYDRQGWVDLGGTYGRDETTGNLQGSISTQHKYTGSHCYLANGGQWGNPAGGLIVSGVSLGNVLSETVYTLSMYAKGSATPVVLELLAGGVVVTPTSSVSPALSGDWQEFSRTYDDVSLNSYVGQALTIVLGVGRNSSGTQSQFDDVSLSYYVALPPGQATNPNPPNGATEVWLDFNLKWTADDGSQSNDVYFGTDPSPDSGEFQDNRAGAFFDPGTMAEDTTYYWRIDAINTYGTTPGEVWSFTTTMDSNSNMYPPVANDQSYYMRAAELLVLPITLAVTDRDGDALTYYIVSGPSNGTLIGTGARIEYLPDSTFRGQDSFTYKASDNYAESNVATVTIDVAEESCTSAQIGNGPIDSLFVHVPSHLVTADISVNQHTVTLTGDVLHESASSDPAVAGHPPFVSRNDLTNKTITIDFGVASINVPLSISFKLMPTSDTQNEIIMQSNAFVIEDDSGGMTSTYYDNGSGQTSVTNNNSTLKTRSCNHFAVVLGSSLHKTYLNGYATQAAANTSNLRDIDGTISIGPYPGKVWDIRIYERILTPAEILDLGGSDCSDDLLSITPYPGLPNYLIGVYIDEWWPDHATESLEEFQYYLHAQDKVYERNLFEAGMYARNDLCGYFANGGCRSLELSDGIRNGFVEGWTFSNPLRQSNGDYWLHENFHSYQGRLGNYLGFGMSKFMLESGASWGPDHNIAGARDTLLAYYSMHPHLPLWTIQNSPVDMRAGWEFKGGHQYGAYIFWSYFANHVANKMWVGDVHSTPGHPRAAYDLLAVQGHDMALNFGDFAARITTWDIPDGPAYAASEQASLSRMIGAKPECPRHDNKITTTYNTAGTGNQWTSVPELYIPGSWAFNAYKVENITENGDYIAAIDTDVANPTFSDFQVRVVVHDTQTDERTYHILDVAAAGVVSQIRFPVQAGDELYLVVATTPDVFSGWDWYEYEYKIYPDPCPGMEIGDMTLNGRVDLTDFAAFASHWLEIDCNLGNQWCGCADFNRIDGVGLDDLLIMCENWLEEKRLPSQASNPHPADGATGVDINADLSWTAGSHATSHDVYFGTSSPGTFQGNQTLATFDPGTMAENTGHYWRIDEVNPWGTTTGTVWSFTTGSGPPPP